MSMLFHVPRRRQACTGQRGVTLIEALVALLVMSFGMLALVGLMSNLRLGADLAKQRSEAMRIARADLAKLRTYSMLLKPANSAATIKDYATDIAAQQSQTVALADTNTSYSVQRSVTDLTEPQAKLVRVTVDWKDRTGKQQFVYLDTIIARFDPVFSAVVGFTPRSALIAGPTGRNPVIPDSAKKLDKNTSAFKPSSGSDRIWVFNNLTGVISSVCTLASGVAFDAVTAADLTGCTSTTSYLLSGTVRFSNTDPARPGGTAGLPEATALPLDLTLVGGSFTVPTVKLDSTGTPVTGVMTVASVVAPTNATSLADNTFYCFNDYADNTQSFINYYCIVTPKPASTSAPYSSASPGPRVWSSQLRLTGLNIGTTAAQNRVCRYSADYNGNGSNMLADGVTLDNLEHPLVYVNVMGSIARQNFLVVRGDVSCPSAADVSPSTGVFADYKTVQLQP